MNQPPSFVTVLCAVVIVAVAIRFAELHEPGAAMASLVLAYLVGSRR